MTAEYGRLAIPALAGLLVSCAVSTDVAGQIRPIVVYGLKRPRPAFNDFRRTLGHSIIVVGLSFVAI